MSRLSALEMYTIVRAFAIGALIIMIAPTIAATASESLAGSIFMAKALKHRSNRRTFLLHLTIPVIAWPRRLSNMEPLQSGTRLQPTAEFAYSLMSSDLCSDQWGYAGNRSITIWCVPRQLRAAT